MVRRSWPVSLAALVAVLGALLFPGDGSAFRPTYYISLTSSGPSPADANLLAEGEKVVVRNTDTTAHTIDFANGSCSEQVAAGAEADCDLSFLGYAGSYGYTVDGSYDGLVSVKPIARSVSLAAKRHSIRRGSLLRLHGRLEAPVPDFPGPGFSQPILILSRPDRQHPYHRVAVVRAKPVVVRQSLVLVWRLRTRPKVGTVYTAEAVYQPAGGRVWVQAFSKPFRVQLRG